jgi:hypothetical protein
VLNLFGEDGAPLAENDDWMGTTELVDAFAAVSAFDLPADSHDAALVVSLLAGTYTVHVTSRDGTTGVALVEIYALPD